MERRIRVDTLPHVTVAGSSGSSHYPTFAVGEHLMVDHPLPEQCHWLGARVIVIGHTTRYGVPWVVTKCEPGSVVPRGHSDGTAHAPPLTRPLDQQAFHPYSVSPIPRVAAANVPQIRASAKGTVQEQVPSTRTPVVPSTSAQGGAPDVGIQPLPLQLVGQRRRGRPRLERTTLQDGARPGASASRASASRTPAIRPQRVSGRQQAIQTGTGADIARVERRVGDVIEAVVLGTTKWERNDFTRTTQVWIPTAGIPAHMLPMGTRVQLLDLWLTHCFVIDVANPVRGPEKTGQYGGWHLPYSFLEPLDNQTD